MPSERHRTRPDCSRQALAGPCRRRAWLLILALAALDVLALATASLAAAPRASLDALLRQRERMVVAVPPEFSREALHAVLYRSDPGPGKIAPLCAQDGLTYGQIDTCG